MRAASEAVARRTLVLGWLLIQHMAPCMVNAHLRGRVLIRTCSNCSVTPVYIEHISWTHFYFNYRVIPLFTCVTTV